MERISFKGVKIIWSLCWTNNLSKGKYCFPAKVFDKCRQERKCLDKRKGTVQREKEKVRITRKKFQKMAIGVTKLTSTLAMKPKRNLKES